MPKLKRKVPISKPAAFILGNIVFQLLPTYLAKSALVKALPNTFLLIPLKGINSRGFANSVKASAATLAEETNNASCVLNPFSISRINISPPNTSSEPASNPANLPACFPITLVPPSLPNGKAIFPITYASAVVLIIKGAAISQFIL